jgi:hypothetical protein
VKWHRQPLSTPFTPAQTTSPTQQTAHHFAQATTCHINVSPSNPSRVPCSPSIPHPTKIPSHAFPLLQQTCPTGKTAQTALITTSTQKAFPPVPLNSQTRPKISIQTQARPRIFSVAASPRDPKPSAPPTMQRIARQPQLQLQPQQPPSYRIAGTCRARIPQIQHARTSVGTINHYTIPRP